MVFEKCSVSFCFETGSSNGPICPICVPTTGPPGRRRRGTPVGDARVPLFTFRRGRGYPCPPTHLSSGSRVHGKLRRDPRSGPTLPSGTLVVGCRCGPVPTRDTRDSGGSTVYEPGPSHHPIPPSRPTLTHRTFGSPCPSTGLHRGWGFSEGTTPVKGFIGGRRSDLHEK